MHNNAHFGNNVVEMNFAFLIAFLSYTVYTDFSSRWKSYLCVCVY